ncbi:MAG: serine hydrolase domain-containing protein [Pseudomonadota bacterium]
MRLNAVAKIIPGVLAGFLLLVSQAQAQTLFTDDFQDGNADGWRSGGDGTTAVTSYAGNYSLRLTKKAFAFIALGIQGPPEVIISVSFAADDLEGDDACVGEASIDGGSSWVEALRVEDGGDDGFTLYSGSVTVETPPEGTPVIIRLRVDGNASNDTCWADNIRVSARQSFSDTPETGPRELLTSEFLLGESALPRPVSMASFAPAEGFEPSKTKFEGVLSFSPSQGDFSVVRDNLNFMSLGIDQIVTPPSFTFAFTQTGDQLVPLERALTRTDHPFWDYIVGPGKVWTESSDNGFTRAAFPFALQENNANCTHNGVMSFLFNDAGDVSRVAYQISSETCYYFQFDMWGVGDAAYVPGEVAGAQAARIAFENELANRIPTKSFTDLSKDFPAIDPNGFASPADVTPESLTTYGVLLDGVHYRSGCATRQGPYPFCEDIALPSYSLSKSIFAGLAMMRAELLYPGVSELLIKDYVPECAQVGWEDVTFGNALDMATGRYRSTVYDEDESASVRDGFFIDSSHKDKIERACNIYPKKSDPGEQWVYHTTDHYILGVALQAFLREQNGPDSDIYDDLLVDPIWRAIGLSPVSHETRRTRDTVDQPFVGWGLTFTPDDLAKIGSFVALDGGAVNGAATLDQDALRAALQQAPDDPGLPAPEVPFRYNNGFWAWDGKDYLGCSSSVWIPFMSGFGGLSMVLMPNDVIYYYISDDSQFAWAKAIVASNIYNSMCEASE